MRIFSLKLGFLPSLKNTVIDYWQKIEKPKKQWTVFRILKNQFEKSPEEIMISCRKKKIIPMVTKMDLDYQKLFI